METAIEQKLTKLLAALKETLSESRREVGDRVRLRKAAKRILKRVACLDPKDHYMID